jgi:hypothetical protein
MKEKYEGYGWVKVKKYNMDESVSWEERYKQLENHHIQETKFLIDEIRKLSVIIDERTCQNATKETTVQGPV